MRTTTRAAVLAAFLTAGLGLGLGTATALECGNDGSGFDQWVEGFKDEAAANGISQSTINSALSGLSYSSQVMKLDRNQSHFRQSFEEFSGRMIPPRVARAKSRLQEHASVLSRIEAQYGVPGEVLVALWGLETDFGAVKGKLSTINSLATLAYDCRRSDFFRSQLMAALRIIDAGDLTPAQMRGGWAGEIGQTQFLPTSYLKYAVDFDGDGHKNLIGSSADVLASTANYLRGYGWQSGQPWTEGTHNFQVLLEWNKSQVYTRTVAEFARRLQEGA